MGYCSDDVLLHAKDVASGLMGIDTVATVYRNDIQELLPLMQRTRDFYWAPRNQQARLLRDDLEEMEFCDKFYAELDGDQIFTSNPFGAPK